MDMIKCSDCEQKVKPNKFKGIKIGVELEGYEKIKEALNEILDNRNQEVEESLFKCCNGYSYYEEVVTKVKEEVEGENGIVLIKEDVKISKVKKYKGPDIVAQKYWLNNRKKVVWKDDPHKVANDKKLTNLKRKRSMLRLGTYKGGTIINGYD